MILLFYLLKPQRCSGRGMIGFRADRCLWCPCSPPRGDDPHGLRGGVVCGGVPRSREIHIYPANGFGPRVFPRRDEPKSMRLVLVKCSPLARTFHHVLQIVSNVPALAGMILNLLCKSVYRMCSRPAGMIRTFVNTSMLENSVPAMRGLIPIFRTSKPGASVPGSRG